jgi:D-alanyl-D-alanine dipeptidase
MPVVGGSPIDFGSSYDDFSESGRMKSHREYPFNDFPPEMRQEILSNRRKLDSAFEWGSQATGTAIQGLLTEWWDYRVPNELTSTLCPISDSDLPPEMRMVLNSEHCESQAANCDVAFLAG